MTVGTKGETFFIKQKVAVLTSFKNAVLISIYLSNKRLAIKFKNGNTYSIPISKLSDITITEKQWIKISFFNNENIPEISTHGIDRITFAQVKKNNEGKTIITTSTDWINNWIFNFSNQTENKENNNFSKSPNQLKVSYNSPSSYQKQKIQKSSHTNRHQISFMSTLKFWKENNNNSYRRIMSVFPIIGILFIILLISQQGGIGANTNVNAGESYINSFPEMTDSPTPIITMSINQEKIDKVRTSEETYLKINEFVSTCDESIGEIEKIKSQIADAAHDEDRDKISKLNNEIKATISHDKILGLSNEMNINNRELKIHLISIYMPLMNFSLKSVTWNR